MGYTRTKVTSERYQLKVNGIPYGINSIKQYANTRTGEKVIAWKDKIKNGRDAVSPYTLDASRVDRLRNGLVVLKYASAAAPNTIVTETFDGFGFDVFSVSHSIALPTAVENEALMKIIKKVRHERSHLNGQAFVGELREAIHGLRHPFQSMREQVYAHLTTLNKRKRGLASLPEPKRRKAWRETVSGTWLETNFGLRPLVNDVKEIAEALGRFQFEQPIKRRLQSKAFRLDRTDWRYETGFGDHQLRVHTDCMSETSAFCTYSVGMEMTRAPAGSLESLKETLGFNLENFVPALYEVMPWSWLADYFTNLGDIINAGTTSHQGITWISKTVGRISKDIYTVRPNRAETVKYLAGSGRVLKELSGVTLGEATLSKSTLVRSRPATLGIPAFTLNIPERGVQIANMLAICGQMSGRTYEPARASRLMKQFPL